MLTGDLHQALAIWVRAPMLNVPPGMPAAVAFLHGLMVVAGAMVTVKHFLTLRAAPAEAGETTAR